MIFGTWSYSKSFAARSDQSSKRNHYGDRPSSSIFWLAIKFKPAVQAVAPKQAAAKTPAPANATEERTRRKREFDELVLCIRGSGSSSSSPSSPFAHLASNYTPVGPDTTADQIIAAAAKARGEIPIATTALTGTARDIVKAAELARGPAPERPAPTGLAAQIIAAGKKRRGEA